MKLSRVLPVAASVGGLAVLTFFYGFAASHYGLWPSGILSQALDQAEVLVEPGKRDLHRLRPALYGFDGVRANGEIQHFDDTVLITSYWPEIGDQPGARMMDSRGEVLHTWNASASRIWADADRPELGWLDLDKTYVHGAHVFENGDLLLSAEYVGLARLRADGSVIWRLDRQTHHSVHQDENGNFWVTAARTVDTLKEAITRFPGLDPPFVEDLALLVSPSGEVLREISILDVVFASRFRQRFWEGARVRTGDIMHMNDVEPLPSSLASQYPRFKAGDLLVSLRDLDLVLVLDPDEKAIRWSCSERFLRQHDPDFSGDGWITVYDNRDDSTLTGILLGGSRIARIHTGNGRFEQIYPSVPPVPGERQFYSEVGGKLQELPDGNLLFTEPARGRALQVDADGRTVWEWVKQRQPDGLKISEVLECTRYPFSPELVRSWTKD